MNGAPVLVLQMQRMGDLIMTFPLLGWLQRHYAGHPVWVMAEERFFTPLQAVAPSVVFFPPEAAPRMRGVVFHRIINLSHRADAAALCGTLQTEKRYGPYTMNGSNYVAGYWALYRASIVHNNRYNRFHWSDLQLLDHVAPAHIPRHTGTPPTTQSRKVCLVVGASEQEKRPSPEFWGALARNLVQRGLHPFFVGSAEDIPLGQAASRVAQLPAANMCGRFSLAELTNILRETRLCITPDTGPMHLAAWVGVPVLNVSVGPVNPWETGPLTLGQYVVRAALSCAGCWHCAQGACLCQKHMTAEGIAALGHAIIHRPEHVGKLHISGMRIHRTARAASGLYALTPTRAADPTARQNLASFWQSWFLELAPAPHTAGSADSADTPPPSCLPQTQAALHALQQAQPALSELMQQAVLRLGHVLAQNIRGKQRNITTQDFWRQHAPLLRPLTSNIHLRLQNAEFAPHMWHVVLQEVELLASLFRH